MPLSATAAHPHNGQCKTRRALVDTDLEQRLFETRQITMDLMEPLTPEDQSAQAFPDASPTKWHIAHTTWFFETFILIPHLPNYICYDTDFNYCFNSYYESQGSRQPRTQRGLLTRPSYSQILGYRAYVDEALRDLFRQDLDHEKDICELIEIGINHEQQHQELILTDILSLFALNPLRPAYRESMSFLQPVHPPIPLTFTEFSGGLETFGHDGTSFAYDNEGPRHKVYLRPYKLANRLVTNDEWLAFMEDGGYRNPSLWLSDGYVHVQGEGWTAPLYWEKRNDQWHQMTLFGLKPLIGAAPVCHISFYEADAFAHWANKRLPTEFEWESAARNLPSHGNMLAASALQPLPALSSTGLSQIYGDVWEWTQSPYTPYPGYRALPNAIGEYNGKFMCNQQVLRGGSCITPHGHIRASYRNFFFPHQRWQFSGLRLADEAL